MPPSPMPRLLTPSLARRPRSRAVARSARALPWRPLAAALALAAALLPVPLARGMRADNLSLIVNFSVSGQVTVTLPNGAPVGTTSGPPTVIPAGFYTIVLNGPGDCITLPLWELTGPGVNIQDDMLGGEVDTHDLYAYFQPNATYTWHLDRNESVVYSFRASSTVVGTGTGRSSVQTTTAPAGAPAPTSEDVVGSAIVPFRGLLVVTVGTAGKPTLSFRGKRVVSLPPGRYTIEVVDRSRTRGLVLTNGHRSTDVTGSGFVGRRSVSAVLTTGTWRVLAGRSAGALSFAVR